MLFNSLLPIFFQLKPPESSPIIAQKPDDLQKTSKNPRKNGDISNIDRNTCNGYQVNN